MQRSHPVTKAGKDMESVRRERGDAHTTAADVPSKPGTITEADVVLGSNKRQERIHWSSA